MMTNKRKSMKQEKSVAKEMDARVVVASGAKWFSKGDVRSEEYLIECKTTDNIFYPLNVKIWEKIEEEAIRDRLRIPLIILDIQKERFIISAEKDFSDVLKRLDIAIENDIRGDRVSRNIYAGDLEFAKLDPRRKVLKFKLRGRKKIHNLIMMYYKDFEEVR